MDLDRFILTTREIGSEDGLFAVFADLVSGLKADVFSYHIVLEHLRRLSLDQSLIVHSFPEAWVQRYRDMGYYEIDPIIGHAVVSTEPFHWFDIDRLVALTPKQQEFLKDLRSHGLVDGFAVPVFGPKGTVAYFGIGSTKHTLDLACTEIVGLMYACHQVHSRFSEIHDEPTTAPSALSTREREVLTWLAQGKSNSVIAMILGISEHTVDTLVRRSFQKLGVSDRVSAAVTALGTGQIALWGGAPPQ